MQGLELLLIVVQLDSQLLPLTLHFIGLLNAVDDVLNAEGHEPQLGLVFEFAEVCVLVQFDVFSTDRNLGVVLGVLVVVTDDATKRAVLAAAHSARAIFRTKFLLLRNCLLQSFIVHIHIAHGLLLNPAGLTTKGLLVVLVVQFELVLNAALLSLQLVYRQINQVLALHLAVVKA